MAQSNAQSVPTPQEDQATASNKPVDKFIEGPVHVSIWENSGSKGAFRSASFELRYKNDQDQWQTGRSYSASNLKHLESAAHEARSRIESWQQANPAKPAP
jgi:hypothetical protein